MATTSRSTSHQLIVLAAALALVGGLFVLPKGIMKPKESRSELSKDAAATANRDGGGSKTNGSKTEASSGPVPATATDNGGAHSDDDGHDHSATGTAAAPHTAATAAQRQELNRLLKEYNAAATPAAKATVATTLARRYNGVERFDSAGYYLEQVALAKPTAANWQQAADAYYQAFSFAATDERVKLLGGKTRELYAKVLEKEPGNLDAKTNLGMAYMASDNPVQGISYLREVLEVDPRNEKALYNMGILAVQSNQYDKAVQRFKDLVKVNPKNVNGQFYLGVTLARTGAKAEAKQAFLTAKSLSNDPALAASVEEEIAKLK
ncbi:tetratricopeptide repeat protein [Hymenobacter properus]|uniref:Tetratricopeptide repeat protein n=1 Tax=Hymenobacter properus TaxID=2791026 RepID=A0A931FIY0_9BACT|nr:tetratricopeptide repeat protein [Hymenobacter properus]MBF9142452.1 tetratricopeptide repeat protein [Hymenobacter properus]MBR7721259.1 tetratricopeptide repeat protein [Microvirga sp. SRT04]